MHSAVYDLAPFVLLLIFVGQVLPEKCTTPDKKEGECISLYSCEAVGLAILNHNSESIELVRQSNCGGTASRPKVCCPLPENKPPSTTPAPKKSIVSDRRYCGYQHADDYFRPDDALSLDEFPWLAYFLYEVDGNRSATVRSCNGVLISTRYVLSSEACTKLQSPFDKTRLVGVRLGDFNLQVDIDCVKDSELDECSNPFEEVGIETAITYTGPNEILLGRHNLVLVRLNRTLEYSDYIRPICLPQPSTAAKMGDTLALAGWDNNIYLGYFQKRKILTNIVNNTACGKYIKYIKAYEHHLCTFEAEAYGLHSKIAGAPLMFSFRNQWQVEGISQEGQHGYDIQIRVAHYVEWIERNVKL